MAVLLSGQIVLLVCLSVCVCLVVPLGGGPVQWPDSGVCVCLSVNVCLVHHLGGGPVQLSGSGVCLSVSLSVFVCFVMI